MINIEVCCPFCQKSLMNKHHRIKDVPSVELVGKLPAEAGATEGTIRLSAFYGDYQVETNLVIPPNTIVNFKCPYCHKDLTSSRLCDACMSPMVALEFPRGGKVQFCSKRGCKKHLIEFEDPEEELRAFYEDNSSGPEA